MSLSHAAIRARAESRPGAHLREIMPMALAIAACEADAGLYADEPPFRFIVARREAWTALAAARAARSEARRRIERSAGPGGGA